MILNSYLSPGHNSHTRLLLPLSEGIAVYLFWHATPLATYVGTQEHMPGRAKAIFIGASSLSEMLTKATDLVTRHSTMSQLLGAQP